ncbi:hypothetical protein M8J77_012208 [Diaphorina citri]|nr:hypothetical protein M8J77_012208 [Diaphorina citri]
MVLTRKKVDNIEEKSGKVFLTKSLNEEVYKLTLNLYTELAKIFDSNNVDVVSRTLLNNIVLTLEKLDEELKANTQHVYTITAISKENEKLKETVQSLEQKCADQRKINNSLLDEGGVNEEEISRKQNEDAKLISSLRKKIETKDMEISQLQETIADMKSSIKKLTDENLNTKVLLDARLNEEENRKKKETQQTSQPGTSAQSSRPGTNAQSSRPGTSTQSLSTADNVEEPSSPPTPSDVATGAEDNYTDHVTKPDININKLFVIGDSHTRELQSILQQSKSSKFVAKVICMPGSTFGQVVNAIKPDKVSANTMICVVAGTNDVFKTSWNSIQSSIDKLYSKCKNNQILIVLSPPRFDVKRINKHIINLNVKVKHYISKYKNMTCLDPHNFINIHHMSTDLLHLNGRGKFLLCSKIVHKVFGSSLSVDTATVHNSNKSIHSNQHYRNNQHNQHKLQFNRFSGHHANTYHGYRGNNHQHKGQWNSQPMIPQGVPKVTQHTPKLNNGNQTQPPYYLTNAFPPLPHQGDIPYYEYAPGNFPSYRDAFLYNLNNHNVMHSTHAHHSSPPFTPHIQSMHTTHPPHAHHSSPPCTPPLPSMHTSHTHHPSIPNILTSNRFEHFGRNFH